METREGESRLKTSGFPRRAVRLPALRPAQKKEGFHAYRNRTSQFTEEP